MLDHLSLICLVYASFIVCSVWTLLLLKFVVDTSQIILSVAAHRFSPLRSRFDCIEHCSFCSIDFEGLYILIACHPSQSRTRQRIACHMNSKHT